MSAYRIAAFFAPEFDHLLWAAGSRWLGRDARQDRPEPAAAEPATTAVSPVDPTLTATPRRYGFHGTLKPPLLLASADTPELVAQTTQTLVSPIQAFAMPALSVQILDGFLALRPARRDDPALTDLNQLAATLVRGLDRFRPPSNQQETSRRAAGLTRQQLAMLEQWGYPYVLDTWRFHMTLSRRLDQPGDRPERALAAARAFFAPVLDEPLWCRDVCLFVEPAPASDFFCWRRVPLNATGSPASSTHQLQQNTPLRPG